ncbi:MAG: hypothetical protein U9N49_11625 [Campylobacterota bacterium]|nr:hypothetical protein [Campylobacterota bacterium]
MTTQKIHLDISSEIVDKVLNFLNQLPKNQLKIEIEPQKENKPIHKKQKSLKGVFNKYANSSKQAVEDQAWQQHIIDKYKND